MGIRIFATLLLVTASFQISADESKSLKLVELADNTWLYTTYMQTQDYGKVPLNGVVVISDGEAAIIDLPANDADTNELLNWIDSQGAKTVYVVPQHFHSDSSGGLTAARQYGAKAVMLDKTRELLPDNQHASDIVFQKTRQLQVGQQTIELAHLGGGHTVDSVVAWLPRQEILVGGCLIKSAHNKTPGYLGDADLDNYVPTLKAIKSAYTDASIVTPGHGKEGGLELIDHTVTLLETHFSQSQAAE